MNEAERRTPDRALAERFARFDDAFTSRFAGVLDAVARAIISERVRFSSMTDADVSAAVDAVAATLKTMGSGLYYEAQPEGGPAAAALARSLNALFASWMNPADPGAEALRLADAQQVVELIAVIVGLRRGVRPRSRAYIDWLGDMFGELPPAPGSAIIMP